MCTLHARPNTVNIGQAPAGTQLLKHVFATGERINIDTGANTERNRKIKTERVREWRMRFALICWVSGFSIWKAKHPLREKVQYGIRVNDLD